MSASEKLRIAILGYVVRGPLGGAAWHHLQYVLGLTQLGHDVIFLEDSDDFPSCYDPSRHTTDTAPSYGLRFAETAFNRIGMGSKWAYYDAHTSTWLGPLAYRLSRRLDSFDIVFNVSGINPLRPWFQQIPRRILVDTDPVFTQIRHLQEEPARARGELHTHYFSFGENLGNANCLIPHDGFDWKPTRQPVVLGAWPVTPGVRNGAFTTVMQWHSYKSREYQGQHFGMKALSLEEFIDLPQNARATFELALGSASAPRDLLRDKGWRIADPLAVTLDPWTYQKYIQDSKAEFSVAKHGYVISNSGWFSERSAVYLASGRPVVTQETGFSEHIPCGRGLFSFRTAREAVAAIDEVNGNYDNHCRWAREIAEEYFDAKNVLSAMLNQIHDASYSTSI